MQYKTDWESRFQIETKKLQNKFPHYQVIAPCSSRSTPNSPLEINTLIELKHKNTRFNRFRPFVHIGQLSTRLGN